MPTATIKVHHLNNSRSQRVLWMLEELELPYELVKYDRMANGLAPPTLQAVHPLGKSPVIQDGEVVVAESGAILEYLVDAAGGKLGVAAGTAAQRDYRYWMHYAEGSLMPLLLMKLVFARVKSAPMPFFVKPVAKRIANTVEGQFVAPNLERHVAFIADWLAKRTWFVGDGAALTAADVQMSFPMEALAARVPGVPAVIANWVTAMKARPAFQRALDKGGSYDIMS
jgi:glutathione S-transferase|nr:glutathione S-transferase [Kofleriaceae bacterium]